MLSDGKRGRPRKEPGRMLAWQFMRVVMVLRGYDEARAKDQKHSVAVAEAVKFVRDLNPNMPISETVVRRILATFRPRGGVTVLRIERAVLSEEFTKNYEFMREEAAAFMERMGLGWPPPPRISPTTGANTFTMSFAEKPNYPRFNRKTPIK
jgi:hypothetical protein